MTGAQFAFVSFLFFGLPLAAALAWLAKRRYTAAVVRLQATGGVAEPRHEREGAARVLDRPSAPTPVLPLQIHIQPAADAGMTADAVNRLDGPAGLRRRVLAVQAISELAYWTALILLMIVSVTGQVQFGLLRRLVQVLVAFVVPPVAVAWTLQAGLPRRLMTVAAAAVVVYAVSLVWSNAEAWQSEVGFSFGFAAITLSMSAFLRPTIRGAGAPLAAASIAAWVPFSLLFAMALALEGPDNGSDSLTEIAIGVSELLIMTAVSIWCAWRALAALSTRYAAKRFSDVQLALAAYWALLTMWAMASIVSESTAALPFAPPVRREWFAAAVVCLWLVWRWVQAAALRAVVRSAGPSIGALLLLRVFKPSGRSQAFTDRFFAHWRFAAPVWMIAGPDLAGAYLEPHEFFAFLRGRLRDQFVTDPGDAPQRVSTLDPGRDPDGRFRITELYCTADTWQPTVLEMMARAGVILLDLREYSEARQGTRYELTALLRRAPLSNVIVLVDAGRHVITLREQIESIWREVARFRPDAAESPQLSVLQFRRGSTAEMLGLFRAAVAVARSGAGM
jgi:hypothetical protein